MSLYLTNNPPEEHLAKHVMLSLDANFIPLEQRRFALGRSIDKPDHVFDAMSGWGWCCKFMVSGPDPSTHLSIDV